MTDTLEGVRCTPEIPAEAPRLYPLADLLEAWAADANAARDAYEVASRAGR